MRAWDALRRAIFRKRNAYRLLFGSDGNYNPAAQIVLADLRKFCRADSSTAMLSPVTRTIDPIASAMAEGRREVWLRITQNLNVSDADLYRIVEEPESGTD